MAGLRPILANTTKNLTLHISFGAHAQYVGHLRRICLRHFGTKKCIGERLAATGGEGTDKNLPIQYKFFSIGNVLLDHTARLSASEIDVLQKLNIPENSKGELDLETLRKLKQDACGRVKCIESPGGSALNTVRLITNLGSNALFIGAVGDDDAGKKLRKYFDDHKINAHLFPYKDAPTGECMSIINKDTNAEVLYANIGAAEKISVSDLKKVEHDLHFLRPLDHRQIIYIEGFMLPHSPQVCRYVLENYICGRRWLALNLSAEFIVRQNFDIIMEFIDAANFIFGNGIEFCALADRMGFGINSQKVVDKIFEKPDAPRVMIITNDKHSVYVLGNVDLEFDKAGKMFYRKCKIEPVKKVIDPTGAGDSFVAGFLHAFLNDYSFKDCVHVGSEVAKRVVTTIGCNLPEGFDVKTITNGLTKIKKK